MRKLIPLKFVAHLLLLIMMLITLHGALESAHAMQDSVSASGDSVVTQGKPSAPHACPCAPPTEDEDDNGCDNCISCECHTPLTVSQQALNYDPIISGLRFFDPYQHLPEVFLSKFIPPQNLA